MTSRRSILLTVPLAAVAATTRPRDPRPDSLASPLGRPRPASQYFDVTRAEPDAAAIAATAGAIRGFTTDVYRRLALSEDSSPNLVCSPYSVAVALAMVRAGARGATASEIDAVLHAPEPVPDALDEGFNALDQLMISQYRDQDDDALPQLAVGNSLWPQADLPVERAFLETLARFYGAGTHPVDFRTATEAARQEINAWVSDHTNERIPELLLPGILSSSTLFVLVNTLYLKASWQSPFLPEATAPDNFYAADGRTLAVPMMTGTASPMRYLEADGWCAVDIPYVGSQLAMAVVIPTRGDLTTLEAAIDGPWLTDLFAGFTSALVRLRMPRWESRVPVTMGELLSQLGMPTAFSPQADFSGISPVRPLFIDKVVHETFISVDEKGTEAAAATAIGSVGSGQQPPVPKQVTVDRPFCYVIHDVRRATPLFIGRVGDPTMTS
ncbi:MAG: serpin family protein [Dactylosporangium sp.]|nr:serpin family protein [Dactylosporangium sp.]